MNEGNLCPQVSNLGSPWDSPFEIHRDIILDDYGTAAKLHRIVLSLYNGYTHPVELPDIAGMDMKNFGIVLDLMTSYRTLGENDATFMKLAAQINKKRARVEE